MLRFRLAWSSLALVAFPALLLGAESEGQHASGHDLSYASIIPFALLLLGIAIFPLTIGHWWEHNRNKLIVVTILSLPILLFVLPVWTPTGMHEIFDKFKEYVSFIALLAALYVISEIGRAHV